MNRSWQRCFAGAVALLTAAAFASGCSEPPAKTTTTPPPETKSQLILTRVGPGAFEARPGDPFTLSALLALTEKGPVADAQVKWRATERPGAITIEGDTSSTNGDGVAQLKVTCVDEGTFNFRADSDGAASKAVWKVECKKPLRYFRIVDGQGVVVADAPQNTKAIANAAVNSVLLLSVKATQTSNGVEKEVPGETVVFQVSRGVTGTAFAGSNDPGYKETQTNGLGVATMQLKVGSTTGPVTILAMWGNLPAVQFDITVVVAVACDGDHPCKSNQVCVDSVCQPKPTGGGLTCGSSDIGCPLGYTCVPVGDQKLCQPIGSTDCDHCPDGFTCDVNTNECTKTDPDCTTDAQCPNGLCRYGVCYPNNPGNVIDTSGHWYTKHDFNVQDALPGWVQFGGSAIRTIDQILLGQLNLPSWVNALIRGVVNQYVPSWVQTLVYLLDNMLTLFSNLRAEGEMDLSQVGGPALLAGTEQWNSFVFYLLSQCGQNIGGDPSMPPPCARVDIYTTELDAADLAVAVKPFTAKVIGPQNGPFQIVFDRREANLKLAGIIKYVLDQAISITTGYPSLEGPPGQPEQGALYNLVDCPGIAQQIMAAGLPIDVTGLCQAAVIAVSQVLADQLRNMVVSTDVLSFYGQAAAYDSMGGTQVATDLGYADFETRSTPDGQWTGRVSLVASVKNVPGRWRASREPIPATP